VGEGRGGYVMGIQKKKGKKDIQLDRIPGH
jgi:hypothetical protein